MKISTAVELLRKYFWLDFVELDGCVFLAWTNPQNISDEARQENRIEREAAWNHTYLIDLFSHNADRESLEENAEHFFNSEHPDFSLLCEMGMALAQMWFLKLRADFPCYDFRVYYTEKDNPIVRFHKVRSDEGNQLDESNWSEAIKRGEIIVFDARTHRDEQFGA